MHFLNTVSAELETRLFQATKRFVVDIQVDVCRFV